MERIKWDDSFSVGVKKLDEQHRQIVGIINKLIDTTSVSVDSELISDTLTEMRQYASDHFETEEHLLTEYKYPDYKSHKDHHIEFRKNTAGFSVDTLQYKRTVPAEILTYLKEWWVNHILNTDMEYKAFFIERGVK
ncbi:MAG: bacteriohemerythrin [Candidatus Desantisbacteria bacterium]